MSDQLFMVVQGQFICKTCKVECRAARFWYGSGEISWLCSEKHISKVGLKAEKKKKKDFAHE
jgi:hypothetical protein